MTISPYHVDAVLSAYSKQSRLKVSAPKPQEESRGEKREDVVTLSPKGLEAAEAYKKISYSLVDLILKDHKKP